MNANVFVNGDVLVNAAILVNSDVLMNADGLVNADILVNARLLVKARGPHLFVALLKVARETLHIHQRRGQHALTHASA